MSKKTLFIVIGAVVLIGLAVGAYFLFFANGADKDSPRSVISRLETALNHKNADEILACFKTSERNGLKNKVDEVLVAMFEEKISKIDLAVQSVSDENNVAAVRISVTWQKTDEQPSIPVGFKYVKEGDTYILDASVLDNILSVISN